MAKKGLIEIKKEHCKGCYLCVRACPAGILKADTKQTSMGVYPVAVAREDACIACGGCYAVCPDMCITIYEREGTV